MTMTKKRVYNDGLVNWYTKENNLCLFNGHATRLIKGRDNRIWLDWPGDIYAVVNQDFDIVAADDGRKLGRFDDLIFIDENIYEKARAINRAGFAVTHF